MARIGLSTSEAAKELRVSRSTAYRMFIDGTLQGRQKNARSNIRIFKYSVRNFKNRQRLLFKFNLDVAAELANPDPPQ
jgi:excisionase family DNA binding protein